MKSKELIEKLKEYEEVVDEKNKRIAELEARIKEQEELLLNPNLQIEKLIKKLFVNTYS